MYAFPPDFVYFVYRQYKTLDLFYFEKIIARDRYFITTTAMVVALVVTFNPREQ